MNKIAILLVLFGGLSSGPAVMAGPVPASSPRVLTTSAAREVDRLARSMPSGPRQAQAPQPRTSGWIARHPRLFGALVGFGVGCTVGAAGVGGSDDNFFNALDEFACPVVGGIGAAAGALVGALVK